MINGEPLVVDLSFAWNAMTGKLLKSRGVDGVIGYVSEDPQKNVSKARFQDWLDSGLWVSLVWENLEQDPLQGAAEGTRVAKLAYQQAKALGYDIDNRVLSFACDWNTSQAQLPAVGSYVAATANVIPHNGVYGNMRLLDYCAAARIADFFWQSNSTSFSDYRVSNNAHLLQFWADSRVAGLPVDANSVLRKPLNFMGEEPQMTQPQVDSIIRAIGDVHTIVADIQHTLGWAVNDAPHPQSLVSIRTAVDRVAASLNVLPNKIAQPTPDQVAAAVVAALPPVIAGQALTQPDLDAIQNTIVKVLAGTTATLTPATPPAVQ